MNNDEPNISDTTAFRLEPRTIQILTHVARLNLDISVDAGTDVIRTINDQRTIYAKAIRQQAFPVDLTLHDLGRFLRSVKLAGRKHTISIEGEWAIISGLGWDHKHRQADLDHDLMLPPLQEPKWPPTVAEFTLTGKTLGQIAKIGRSWAGSVASVVGRGGEILVQVLGNTSLTESVQPHEYQATVGRADVDFGTVEVLDDLMNRLLPGDYQVEIRGNGKIVRLIGLDIEYVLGVRPLYRTNCRCCGAVFEPMCSKLHDGYCSYGCMDIVRQRQRTGQASKQCRWCGERFWGQKGERHCSWKCEDAANDYRISRQRPGKIPIPVENQSQ